MSENPTSSRSFKTLLLASGQGLAALATLGTLAVLSRVFTKGEYGTYQQVMLVFYFAAPLVALGLQRVPFVFLPTEKKQPRTVVMETLTPLAVMGAAFSVFLILGGNRLIASAFNNPDLATALLIFSPFPLLGLPPLALDAVLMARDRPRDVAVFNVISRLARFLLVAGAGIIWKKPEAAVAALVITSAVVLPIALYLMFRAVPGGSLIPRPRHIWQQIAVGFPLGLGTIMWILSMKIDSVLVAASTSEADFAVYANGAIEIPLVAIITDSVTSVLLPEYRRMHTEGKPHEMTDLMGRAMVKCGLILIPMMCFLFLTAEEVMVFLFSEKYAASALPFRLWLLYLPLRTVRFSGICIAAGRQKLLMVQNAFGLIINFILCYYFIKRFGYVGAPLGAVVAAWFFVLPFFVIAFRNILGVPIRHVLPWRQMGLLLLLSASPAAILWFLPGIRFDSPFITILLLGTIYGLLTAILLHAFGLLKIKEMADMLKRDIQSTNRPD